MSQFLIFRQKLLIDKLGEEAHREHVVDHDRRRKGGAA